MSELYGDGLERRTNEQDAALAAEISRQARGPERPGRWARIAAFARSFFERSSDVGPQPDLAAVPTQPETGGASGANALTMLNLLPWVNIPDQLAPKVVIEINEQPPAEQRPGGPQ